MDRIWTIKLLQKDLEFARGQILDLEAKLAAQTELARQKDLRIGELTRENQSLEEALKNKDDSLQKARNAKRAMAKLLKNKSEKVAPKAAPPKGKAAPSPKERGNNNAKRKEFYDLEVREHDVYPSDPGFDIAKDRLLWTKDTIRYEVIPPRFIKDIYHVHSYDCQGGIASGQAPAAPLLNSNYGASVMAAMLQLRYVYSMPVERIIKYFAENGFAINKPTAHNLIKKAAEKLDYLEKPLHQAILDDKYIHTDEVHYTVLVAPEGKPGAKATRKVYFWNVLGHNVNLTEFFYKNGSRAREAMTAYMPAYSGADQTDGYAAYGILDTDAYPGTIHLCCAQHLKRKFIDCGEGDKDAGKIIDIVNQLYHIEHTLPDLPPPQLLAYRRGQAEPVLARLKIELDKIKDKKKTLPSSTLGKAVTYALGQLQVLPNYLLDLSYELDNNRIERVNRYISLSRRNSLFCGSHQGAERAALLYSLACSCMLNNINTFDYFNDILTKLIDVNPNTSQAYLRNLLPDKWNKNSL